ncbi:hypothetical protein RLOC_00003218 [Lonchura striata]
MSEC